MIFNFIKKVLLLLVFTSLCFSEDFYNFKGQHFIASYTGCETSALYDVPSLIQAMEYAVNQSGATILSSSFYVFPGDGVTMVFLLSESHASIHTYPECGSCFVDLFTCGTNCSYEEFHAPLASYLNPSHVNQKILIRHQTADE